MPMKFEIFNSDFYQIMDCIIHISALKSRICVRIIYNEASDTHTNTHRHTHAHSHTHTHILGSQRQIAWHKTN